MVREVILGKGSQIWQTLRQRTDMAERFKHSIGHAELKQFEFTSADRVWVLAYSTAPEDNTAMLQHLQQAGVAEIVYITSSSTIIAPLTNCYAYPRAKKIAEDEAMGIPQCKVLTLGLVVAAESELPAGSNAVTTINEIATFFLHPRWSVEGGKRAHLLRIVQRPFRHRPEQALYEAYGWLMRKLVRRPCLLRPLDLILRTIGIRWYGYTFLSNHLWTNLMTS